MIVDTGYKTMADYRVAYVRCSDAALKKPVFTKLLFAYALAYSGECFGAKRTRYDRAKETIAAANNISLMDARHGTALTLAASLVLHTEEIFFVLDTDGDFVAGCTTRQRTDRTKRNEIDNVCVALKHRGKGVCGLMIAAVAKLYSDRDDDVRIACEPKNDAACRCYSTIFSRRTPGAKLTYFSGIRREALKQTPAPRKL